jgi:hypothetical protein
MTAASKSDGIVTGTDAIRAAVRSYRSKPGIAFSNLARDIDGQALADLDRFADGRTLPPELLMALTAEIWSGSAIFDPELDRLRPAPRPKPQPLCAGHPPRRNPSEHQPAATNVDGSGSVIPGPENAGPPSAGRIARLGWA